MLKSWSTGRAGQIRELWPVMLLLLVVVAPTIGLLWFVSLAMRNEELAHRQRLSDAYRGHLLNVQQHIDEHWQQVAQNVAEQRASDASSTNGQQRFVDALATGPCDSAICFDEAGNIAYPQAPPATTTPIPGQNFRDANRVEFEHQNPGAAAAMYGSIASSDSSSDIRASAVRAQVRCLFKNRRPAEALSLVIANSTGELSTVRDAQQRLLAAGVELMAIELVEEHTLTKEVRQRLLGRLKQHDDQRLPASQRLFILKRLHGMNPEWVDAKLLRAEELAARFVAVHPSPARKPLLRQSQLPDVWQMDDGENLLMLFSTSTAKQICEAAAAKAKLPAGIEVEVVAPGDQPVQGEMLSLSAGPRLPGWRLSLAPPPGITQTSSEQQAIYIWAGLLVTGFTSVLAVFIAVAFRRQIRVANLKNDLVGTVSHELKTPLSSMRLLVDTLLESESLDPQQTREYLQLIARENTRLSRVIENFLTFSRIERSNQTFELRPVDVNQIVTRGIEAAGERFRSDDCSLSLDLACEAPVASADADALLMVLLNLLDNAYKYSSSPREILIRTSARQGHVHLSVVDNGRGLTRAEKRRIFQKFYQVDQSLSREDGGCGLGLAIVNSIVRTLGGSVKVISQPGQGSTFTVELTEAKAAEVEA